MVDLFQEIVRLKMVEKEKLSDKGAEAQNYAVQNHHLKQRDGT